MYTGVSPSRLVSRPETGANSRRVRPNAETTAATAVAGLAKSDANISAYCGSRGAMMPKPIAITNAAATITLISVGRGTRAAGGEEGMAAILPPHTIHGRGRLAA